MTDTRLVSVHVGARQMSIPAEQALRALALPQLDFDADDDEALDAFVSGAFEDVAAVMGVDGDAVLDALDVVLAAPGGRDALIGSLYTGLVNASAAGDVEWARWALDGLFQQAQEAEQAAAAAAAAAEAAAAAAATSAALRALELPRLRASAANEAALIGAAVVAGRAFVDAADALGINGPMRNVVALVAGTAQGRALLVGMDYRDLRAACLAGDANKARRVVEELLLRAGAPWTRAR